MSLLDYRDEKHGLDPDLVALGGGDYIMGEIQRRKAAGAASAAAERKAAAEAENDVLIADMLSERYGKEVTPDQVGVYRSAGLLDDYLGPQPERKKTTLEQNYDTYKATLPEGETPISFNEFRVQTVPGDK